MGQAHYKCITIASVRSVWISGKRRSRKDVLSPELVKDGIVEKVDIVVSDFL